MEELFQTRSERRERGCGWCSRRGVQVFFCLLLLDCCRCSPSTCENAVCPSPPTMTTGLVQTVEWQQGVSPSLFSLTPTSSPPTMTTGLTQTVERQQASSITTDGPTVHISQSEMTQVVTMI
ncbi:hypothetical protein GBAR_LOCUS24658, partial [Geodia barretti]